MSKKTTDALNDPLPEMPTEERRNSGLILLILLAQAYYKILECTLSMVDWCTGIDMELNHSYLWVVQSLTNLLENHPDLQDFPEKFEPQLPDLFPSTIRYIDWENKAAPDIEHFLSTVQKYIFSKNACEPKEGSSGWIFLELFRPSINIAIERAVKHNKKMRQYCNQILGESPQPPNQSCKDIPTESKKDSNRKFVFISYSHKDKRWLNDLQTHLKPYVRNGLLSAWSDKQIAPGSKWFPEIKTALAATKIAVLLVSPDFLASDFIHEHELSPLLKEAEKSNVTIIWIPVRACSYEETELRNYQAVIGPEKPLDMMKAERGKAWVNICKEIKKALSSS
jgi:hypothetical protein